MGRTVDTDIVSYEGSSNHVLFYMHLEIYSKLLYRRF